MQDHFADTTKRKIRKALRLDIYKEKDLDWELLLDRDAMAAAYEEAAGLRGLAVAANITQGRCKIILEIHGISINQRGGAYQTQRREREAPPVDYSAVHGIGESYSPELKRVLLFHASKSVSMCTPLCPNVVVCWDAPFSGRRKKKAGCTLRDHLIAVGVLDA
jgi:hypothetical protein